MSFDANAYRESSLDGWEEASAGWIRQQAPMREWSAEVSQAMIAAVAPQPGERVLELAAGLGETGLLAAEMVAPVGSATISDQAEGMLAGARERAKELNISNVEFKAINAEWIDLPLATVDVVLCRYGYMLMADPAAALSETRRVLRPGGHLGLAVWDSIEVNPWSAVPAALLRERGLGGAGAPGPGPFALGSQEQLMALLEDTGFTEIAITPVEMLRRHASFEQFWDLSLDLSRSFHDAVMSRPEPEIAEIRAALATRLEPFTQPDGTLELPGRTLVAGAEA
ncbi:MAG TPA: methyltransferase domain-containing protein [Solirubrobacteraceae bacterium]|jgi:SAM-dependent methyltransferase|nr:methyltransferase domain-containing protein [Solirubrobacteraceae bacterium]